MLLRQPKEKIACHKTVIHTKDLPLSVLISAQGHCSAGDSGYAYCG